MVSPGGEGAGQGRPAHSWGGAGRGAMGGWDGAGTSTPKTSLGVAPMAVGPGLLEKRGGLGTEGRRRPPMR